jgi:outer membrane protein OmpA-like peptidoglycan-associated protein
MIGGAALLWAAPVMAQQRGTVEFGAFASGGMFDKSLTLNSGYGGGGRIGVYLDPRVALEFDMGEMTATRTLGLANVNVGSLNARLVATPIKSGALSILVGVGAGSSTETNFLHTYGVNALVGAKIALSDHVALRIDAISDWMANYSYKSNQSLHVGLSFYRSPNHSVRTVEIPGPATTTMVQRDDSVSAAEQDRRRRWERDYRALRDSLARTPPPPAALPPADVTTMSERILFGFDKSELNETARTVLDAKVSVFNANPSMRIYITGHTDPKGTDTYNMALGLRRAEAAKAYLVSKGVSADRVTIDSKGESEPVVSPSANNHENRPDRRDMFVLITADAIRQP